MNKVYVVTEGKYSEYHIVAIYSTKEQAEALRARMIQEKLSSMYRWGDEPEIEEYDLDPRAEELRDGRVPYWVSIVDYIGTRKDEIDTEVHLGTLSEGLDALKHPKLTQFTRAGVTRRTFDITVLAESKDHAIKIASDIRRSVLAGDPWRMR